MMNSGTFFSISLMLVGLAVAIKSYVQVKQGHFFGNSWWLWPLGVYVWGDGLVLGPFWFLFGLIGNFLSGREILSFWLLFWLVRSGYEVIYWLIYQFDGRKHRPPFFHQAARLSKEQVAIIYQLFHSCMLVMTAYLLLKLWVF